MGLCTVISMLLPSMEMGPTAWCLPAHPRAGGKGGHGCCSCGCQTAMGLVISVEGEDPTIGMLL